MLGLLFIYFIGKIFFDLAVLYSKSKWLFAFLGLLVYYGGTFVFGVIYVIIAQLMGNTIDESNSNSFSALKLFGVVFGFIVCYVFYYLLKTKWKKEYQEKEKEDGIDTIGQNQE